MISASTSINVRFAETDAMGVVYHANYLPWCECARIKLLESFGANYADMYTAGIHLPVVEECLKYKSPTKFGDSVTIVAQIRQKPFARIKVEYEIKVGERIAATGYTVHVFVNNDGHPIKPPRDFMEKLLSFFDGE